MTIKTLSAAIGGALLAGAGVYAYLHYADAPSTSTTTHYPALQLNQKQAGEITSQSLLNLSNGVRSAVYDIQLEANQLVKVEVKGPLRAQISALHQDQLIERVSAEEACLACSTDQAATALLFKAPSAGTYHIAVSGQDTASFGPFSLRVSELQQFAGDTLTAESDLYDWAQGAPVAYPLHIATDGLYVMDLKAMAPNLDPLLVLKASDGTEIAQDDDGGEQLNARLSRYLTRGDYQLLATSATGDNQFAGGFALRIQHQELNPELIQLNRDGGELPVDGQRRSGLYSNQPIPFTLHLDAPQIVTVQLHSNAFIGSLQLGPYRSRSTQNTTQQIRAYLPAGTHTLELDGDNQSGLYELSASGETVSPVLPHKTLRPNQTTTHRLSANLDADLFTLVIAEAGQYVIEMDAERFDTYLQLLQNNQLIAEDDDSGGDLNAALAIWLEPGEYQLLATSFDSQSQAQSYQIRIYED